MKIRTSLPILVGMAAVWLPLSLANAQEVGDIELLAYWDFENTTEDAWNGHEGWLGGNAKFSDGEKFGMALDTSALEGSFFKIAAEPEDAANPAASAFFEAYNGADGPSGRDQLTVAFWQRNTQEELLNQVGFWTVSEEAGGSQRGAQGHTPWSNDNIYFDTAGCCDAATQRINAPSGVEDWMAWNHFAFVKNKSTKQIWVNGELLLEGENTEPLPADMIALYIGNGIEENRDQPGLIDEFAVIAGAASPEQIKELADGATVIDIFDSSDPNFAIGKTVSLGQLPAITTDHNLSFQIRNTGDTKPLNISSATITGGDTDYFTLVSFPSIVDPEGRGTVNLSFNSKSEFRQFAVTMEFKTDDPDADDQTVIVPVRATVLNPVGPIAHYPLDETNVADPAADSTGLGRSGDYRENGGSITLGQAGLAATTGTSARFTGGSNVAVSTLPANALSNFTISLWINPASLGDLGGSDFRTIVARGFDSPIFGLLEASGEFIWFGEADGVADALFLTEGLNLQAGTAYHVAMRYDGTTQMGTFFVNGAEVGSGAVPAFLDEGSLFIGSFGTAGALAYDGTIDDVQVYDIALTTDQIAYLIANPGQELVPDGPVDTDKDGLSDEDELNIHNTDPFVADSDKDGLSDGEEIALGTNPNNKDTDGDGFGDSFEIGRGSDPLVIDVVGGSSLSAGLISYWPFNGDLSDQVGSSDGIAVGADPIAFDVGAFGQGIDLNGVDQFVDTPDPTTFNFSDGTGFTVSAWFRVDGFDKSWQALIASGEGTDWRVHRQAEQDNFAPVGGNGDIGQNSVSVNDGQLHHVALINAPGDGISFYMDGVLIEKGPEGTPEGNDLTMKIGENPEGLGRTWNGLIDDVAIWNRPLIEAEVLQIANSNASLGELLSGVDKIEILGVGAAALLGGDLTDPENDGLDAEGAATDPSWNWVAITANIEADFEGGENAFNIFDNKVGGGNDKWCCDDPTPDAPLWVSVEFAEAISLTHFTITNGNDTPDRDPTNWAIQGSNDGENFEDIFAEAEESIWSETRNEVALVTLGVPSAPYTHLRYIVYDTPGALHQLNEIEYFGTVGGGETALLVNGSFEEPILENINTNNLGTVPTGWSQTGADATWNLIRNDGTPYGSGVDNAADGSQIIDLNGVFELFQNFTLAADSDVRFGASFANREGHDGSDPSTVGIYDADGVNLLSPVVSVDTSADPTPSEVWRSGEATVSLPAGEYQIRIALNNFNNVDAVFANAVAGAPDPRAALGVVASSTGPVTEPTEVDFGELSGDASYEFIFNAVKGGGSTAVAGNGAWGLKLEQWQDTGFFGTTEFGVVDNTSEAPTVFDADVHVVFVSDTVAGETRIYVNGVLAGTTPGNPTISGMGAVMGARDGTTDPMGEGSVMYGWATYNTALSNADIVTLSTAPAPGGGGVVVDPEGPPEITGISFSAAGVALQLPAGTTYDIEFSPDLVNWTVIASDVTGTYSDADAARVGGAEGFYRGVAK